MVTVVTGASGFLGRVLVERLRDEGRVVRAVDMHPGPDAPGVEWRRADVTSPESVRAALEGADSVFHLAAMISVTGDPTGAVWRTNVEGARTVAEAALAEGVGSYVHCSSVHAFDLEATDHVTEASPRSTALHLPAYDRSKAAGEAAVRSVIERGLPGVIVNPTGVIGPFDLRRSRMSQVFVALMRRRLPALVHGGFDWVDARDVVESMLAAERELPVGENFLLSGHHLSLDDLAADVTDVTGVPAPRFTVPMGVAKLAGPFATVMSRRTGSPLWSTTESLHALEFSPTVSREKAGRILGHIARPIRETIADIRDAALAEGLVPA